MYTTSREKKGKRTNERTSFEAHSFFVPSELKAQSTRNNIRKLTFLSFSFVGVVCASSLLDETVKAKKHIRIDHDALRNKKVELWLPIEDSVVDYDNFRTKVQDLLQVHLGNETVLKKMKALDEGTDIDTEEVLNKEIEKGTVILAQTKKIQTSSCFCF